MLRTETVTPATLELLIDLSADTLLADFFLVGGTALSLQIGHRLSVDLDFFSLMPFVADELATYLETEKGLTLNYLGKGTIKGEINSIQVDFITHAYPLVKELRIVDSMRLSSLEDISAMKINSIVGNGTRLKDFVDVAYLSSYISLAQMIEAYETKYTTRNPVMVMKSLAYFDDINHVEPIQMLNKGYKWEVVRKRLMMMLDEPERVFSEL